jgi:hypothetical protein
MGKPEGKRPVGKPRRRWVDSININLGEIGVGVFEWICLAPVNVVIYLQFPLNVGNF